MNIKKIKPMFTKIVTTADKYVEENDGLITDVSKLKMGLTEYQRVISVGSSVRTVKEGDVVCINPDRYRVMKYKDSSLKSDLLTNQVENYNFPMVKLDGQDYLLLDEADVEFIIEEFED